MMVLNDFLVSDWELIVLRFLRMLFVLSVDRLRSFCLVLYCFVNNVRSFCWVFVVFFENLVLVGNGLVVFLMVMGVLVYWYLLRCIMLDMLFLLVLI